MVPFDNRAWLDRLKEPLANALAAGRLGYVRHHYMFDAGRGAIAYCYIRKNASTAFKKLIVDHSPYRQSLPAGTNPIHFMNRYHRATRAAQLHACRARIFVYRCPIERATSLFVNKFVSRSGHEDLFRSYEAVTGRPAASATFESFVRAYLRARPLSTLDPHVWSQASHLHAIRYSHAMHLDDLQADMSDLLGPETAERYFGARTNESRGRTHGQEEDLSSLPAEALRGQFRDGGLVPSHEQLARPDLIRTLEELYADDILLARRLADQRAGGGLARRSSA